MEELHTGNNMRLNTMICPNKVQNLMEYLHRLI